MKGSNITMTLREQSSLWNLKEAKSLTIKLYFQPKYNVSYNVTREI